MATIPGTLPTSTNVPVLSNSANSVREAVPSVTDRIACLISSYSSVVPWGSAYQEYLTSLVQHMQAERNAMPSFQYPNTGFESILARFPSGRVPIFGYGSLMNKASLGGTLNAAQKPTVKREAVDSMQPVVAFGVTRICNYENRKVLPYAIQNPLERAFMNLTPTTDLSCAINGVVIDVDGEDFANLVRRELGYDLVPVLTASWNDAVAERREITFKVAYTFISSDELRDGIRYTNDEILPVRQSLVNTARAVDAQFGPLFTQMYKDTTLLADRRTRLSEYAHCPPLNIS